MESGPAFYVVAVVAIFVLGLSKGGFAGVGMVSTPLLSLVVGPVAAAGVIFPILVIQDVIAVAMYRRTFSAVILTTMLSGAAVGVVLAYLLASTLHEWVVEVVLGLCSIAFALHQLVRQFGRPRYRQSAMADMGWLSVICGAGSGFASMIAHAGTSPFQFYVMPKGLDRDTYVGTSVLFFAATNVMKAPAFFALGQLTASHLKATAVLVPLAIASSYLGVRLVRAIDVRRFNFVVTLILLCVGVTLITRGILG
jgi:uncharacterized membrane protein YfcA